MLKSLGLDMPAKAKEQNGQDAMGEFTLQTSQQAKRHKPSLLFTSLTILTFITR